VKDRKSNELKAGARAFVPVTVEAVADTPGGGCCRARVERLAGYDGEPRDMILLPHDLELATPLCLAAPRLLAACKAALTLVELALRLRPDRSPGEAFDDHVVLGEMLCAIKEAEGRP
jgi:hypothetical protein